MQGRVGAVPAFRFRIPLGVPVACKVQLLGVMGFCLELRANSCSISCGANAEGVAP